MKQWFLLVPLWNTCKIIHLCPFDMVTVILKCHIHTNFLLWKKCIFVSIMMRSRFFCRTSWWDASDKRMRTAVIESKMEFRGTPYAENMALCTTTTYYCSSLQAQMGTEHSKKSCRLSKASDTVRYPPT